ncbi:MAG: hypothetical protein WEC59_12370 [Salibacteraceae bacterium]
MKSFIVTVGVFLYVCSNSFCQFSAEVPNYVLAENSNFIVNIITMADIGIHKQSSYIKTSSFNSKQRIDPKDYEGPNEGLFNALAQMITKEFEKMNMHPAAFLNTDMTKMQDPSFMNRMNEEFFDNRPGFVVNIICMNWEKEVSAFMKNKLELDKVKPVTLNIAKVGETDASKVYYLMGGKSLGQALGKLEKAISEKPDSYFLNRMEIDEKYYEESNAKSGQFDKMLKEEESFDTYPDESELKETVVLVVGYGKKGGMLQRQFARHMDKYYPYKYKLINQEEYMEELKNDYKYMFIPKGYMVNKVKTSSSGRTTSQKVQMIYYVIKNAESFNVYYGNNRKKLESKAKENPSAGMKKALKYMRDYYNWD